MILYFVSVTKSDFNGQLLLLNLGSVAIGEFTLIDLYKANPPSQDRLSFANSANKFVATGVQGYILKISDESGLYWLVHARSCGK